MPSTTPDLVQLTTARLAGVSETPELDAQLLLAHVLERTRTWVLAHPPSHLTTEHSHQLHTMIHRLEGGEPLPYVLGHREFFGLDFNLTPSVLIPRPETELLVETAIAWLRASPGRRSMADIGTGCGCIAICLAHSFPEARVLATDMSGAALGVAVHNALKFGLAERIDFLQCDLLPRHFPGIPPSRAFDLVCANLPYIPTQELRRLPVYHREPKLALDGGPDGLHPFRRLFNRVPEWMAPGGLLLLEIESSNGPATLSLARDVFQTAAIHLHQDLAGRDRLLEIHLPIV